MSAGYALERPTVANMTPMKWDVLDQLALVSPEWLTVTELARKANMSTSTVREALVYFVHFGVVACAVDHPRRYWLPEFGALTYPRLLALNEPYHRGRAEWQQLLPALPETTVAHRILATFTDGEELGAREVAERLGIRGSTAQSTARMFYATGWLSGQMDHAVDRVSVRWRFSLFPQLTLLTTEYLAWMSRMTDEGNLAELVAG